MLFSISWMIEKKHYDVTNFFLLHFIHFQNTKYSGFDHNEWTETQFESIP